MEDAFILRLPNETLSNIVDLAVLASTDLPTGPDRKRYSMAYNLSIVCRRFSQIAQPALYRTIAFSNFGNLRSIVPPMLHAIKLLRSVKANPALGRLCQHLELYVNENPDPVAGEFEVANELLPYFTKVKSFAINGGFENSQHTWPMLYSAFKNMPLISDIYITRGMWGLLFAPLYIIDLAQLRSLSINGISETAKHNYPSPMPSLLPAKEKQRTANFTRLSISDYEGSPTALAGFLTWPKALEEFKFFDLNHNCHCWDLQTLQQLLHPHRSSLKSLTIGSLIRGGQSFLDLSEFSDLEMLKLSFWSTDHSLAFDFFAVLAAPKLHTFTYDFTFEDEDCVCFRDFTKAEVKWLCKLAEVAFSENFALRRIHLIFDPVGYISSYSSYEHRMTLKYPWDLIDEVRDVAKGYGIQVSYTEPCMTKLEFQKALREANKNAEERLN